MLLGDKTAVIYGGGGAIGGAVARAFAREGAACQWPLRIAQVRP
jgi:NAD(P)-dependent dehydrogenase (short-subunit alcohol dehydrogenase family)